MKSKILTFSEMRTKARCGIAHQLAYEWNLKQAIPSMALNVGFLFHEGGAAYLWTGNAEAGLEAIRVAYERRVREIENANIGLLDEDYEKFYHQYSIAFAMLNGWIKHYGLPRPAQKVVGVEVQFSFPFFGCTMAGKIDGLAMDENGRPLLVEWKTSAATGESFKNLLMLDWQTLFYAWALEQVTHVPVNNAIFFLVKQPSIKPCAEESNEQYFERLEAMGVEIPVRTVKGETKKTATAELKEKYPKQPESTEQYRARVIADYEARPEFYFEVECVPLDPRLKAKVPSFVRSMIAHIESDFPATPPWDMRVCEKCWFKTICMGTAEIGIDFVKGESHEELTEVTL